MVVARPVAWTAAPDGTIHRGDLFWLAPDPSRTPAARYGRPHVVVQDDVFNRSRITAVIVCALTSNLNRVHEPAGLRFQQASFFGR